MFLNSVNVPEFKQSNDAFRIFQTLLRRYFGFNFHVEDEYTVTTTRMESSFGFLVRLTMLLIAVLLHLVALIL